MACKPTETLSLQTAQDPIFLDKLLGKYGINLTDEFLEAFRPDYVSGAEFYRTDKNNVYLWQKDTLNLGVDIVNLIYRIEEAAKPCFPKIVESGFVPDYGIVLVTEKPLRSIHDIFISRDHPKKLLLPTETITNLVLTLLTALASMHKCNYIHLAISSDSVSFNGFNELHFSFFQRKFPYETYTNPIEGAPPEVLFKQPCTKKIDLWDLGILLFEIYTGNFLIPEVSDPLHRLHFLEKVLGKIPRGFLVNSEYAINNGQQNWQLKAYTGSNTLLKKTLSLQDKIQATGNFREDSQEIINLVFGLLQGLLKPNPQERFSAREALEFLEKATDPQPSNDDFKETHYLKDPNSQITLSTTTSTSTHEPSPPLDKRGPAPKRCIIC